MTFKQHWEKTRLPPTLSETELRQMLSMAYPNASIQALQIIAGGCSNLHAKVQFVNPALPDVILRVYCHNQHAVHKEQAIAARLKDRLPMPDYLFIGSLNHWTFAVMTCLPGITLRAALLDGQIQSCGPIMQSVGRALASMSQITFDRAGNFDEHLNVIPRLASQSLKNVAFNALEHDSIQASFSETERNAIQSHLEKFAYLLPSEQVSQLVHGDFDPSNLLVTNLAGTWQLSGILDWEFAFSGAPIFDVANMLRYAHQLPEDFTQAFIYGLKAEGVVLPEDWPLTIKLINIINLLECFQRCDPELHPLRASDIQSLIRHYLQEINDAFSSRLIAMEPYQVAWSRRFEAEAKNIQAALGDNCVAIHHIGSTAVPELVAKPIIDILPVVMDIRRVKQAYPDMQALGYATKGEFGRPFREYFQRGALTRTFNVHVFEQGDTEIDRHLRFRDWMRRHSEDRQAYADLKTQLAAQFSRDGFAYALGKLAFVSDIVQKTGWRGLQWVEALTPHEWQGYHHMLNAQVEVSSQLSDALACQHDEYISVHHFVLFESLPILGAAKVIFIAPNTAVLACFAIGQAHQQQGLGRQWLARLERWCKMHGAVRLLAFSLPNAQGFFIQSGFHLYKDAPLPVPYPDCLCFEKPFPPPAKSLDD